MSNGLGDLLCEHGVLSFEKQLVLNDLLEDDCDWGADLDAGTITLGSKTWQCQLLGSESEADESWLWGWANQSGYSPAILQAAEQLRRLGERQQVPELTERKTPAEKAGGHVMSLIAAGVCGGNAYYRGPYDGGAAFLLIRDPAYPPMPAPAAQSTADAFTALVGSIEVPDHRKALLAYARQRQLAASETGTAVWLRFPDGGELAAEFDTGNRLTSLEV